MPKTENDFNNFKDIVYDKYNREGYIIQRDKYYIFQSFNQSEDVLMYYRQNIDINQINQVSLNNYVKQNYPSYDDVQVDKNIDEENIKKGYNFDETLDYYMNRNENSIVGIIDKNTNKLAFDDPDVFKIRAALKKGELKRGTGVSTLKGTVCSTSGSKSKLAKELQKIYNISSKKDNVKELSKTDICNKMKEELLYLEKYSTGKDKKTYIMVPKNHPIYEFPLNLEDRRDYIKQEIYNFTKSMRFPALIS